MPKQILDVGNCGFDHGNLQELFARHFDAEVTQAHGAAEALRMLGDGQFDLVVINRKFDRDGGDGIDLIRQIKTDTALEATPVMLLSNYPQYQAEAAAAGAVAGFGKAELDAPQTAEKLRAVIG